MNILSVRISPILALAMLALPAIACAQSAPTVGADHRLLGADGASLYTYDADGQDTSRCDGPCAALWPPYAAASGTQPPPGFGLLVRGDRRLQWSYHGHPLYRYAGDTAPGTARGDGMNGSWHVARAH